MNDHPDPGAACTRSPGPVRFVVVYMAVDAHTKAPVISLDACWHERPEALRVRAESLECSCCHGPVQARAGERNRWHFAHKNANDCPLSHTDPDRMICRAVLYEWLAAKRLGERLTIEETVKVAGKVHQVDCVVTAPDQGSRFAYLCFAAGVRDREGLVEALRLKYQYYYFIFHAKTLRKAESHPNSIVTTTTHRVALELYGDCGYYHDPKMPVLAANSLHFIEPSSAHLTTHRDLRCKDPPKVFSGQELATPLHQVRISPKTGELIHPTEYAIFDGRKRRRKEEESARVAAAILRQKRRPRSFM